MATAEDDKVGCLASDSNYMYDALNKAGYSKDLAEKRIQMVENGEKSATMINDRNWRGQNNVLILGSAGEGLWNVEVSDIDCLFVQKTVKCFEKNPSVVDFAKYQVVAQLDIENAPPGYTWLECKSSLREELGQTHSVMEILNKSSIEINGKTYLKNDAIFVLAIQHNEEVKENSGWLRKKFEFEERSGPARPFKFPLPYIGYLHVDYVCAISCSYPSIEQWCTRQREYDWPSKELIDDIRKLEIFVVPVRRNDTDDNYFLQWRLSFTLAERTLVRSFNDVQIKLYAAMKMLAKLHLKPVCENITSYIIKNVIFWAFEETKSDEFTKGNFGKLLLQIIGRMKKCIGEKHLPNYMTPERNLLHDKISENEETNLQIKMNEVIKDAREALSKCPIIQKTIKQKENSKELQRLALYEETVYAVLSIPPVQCERVEKMIHDASNPVEIVRIGLKEVVPFIRKENPHGYFHVLVSMSDVELLMIAMEELI